LQNIAQFTKGLPALLQAGNGFGETHIFAESLNQGRKMRNCTPLGKCAWSLHPAFGALVRLLATLVEHQMRQAKRIE
jgi:hypothetical protein